MNKKIIVAVLTGLSVLGVSFTSFADNITVNQSDVENAGENGTEVGVNVNYSGTSTFSVTIPKDVTLDSVTKTGEYTVHVEGNIQPDKKVVVLPVDEITETEEIDFYMVDVSDPNKKVRATVTQEDTEFVNEEISVPGGVDKKGTISAPDLTAGTWSGSAGFKILMNDN